MLDIPPKPDGTLPDTVTKMLNEIGGWLQLNGEGVYATRPANIYGTGSLRFTRNQANNVIYVFDTVWPGNGAQLAVANYNSSNLNKATISKITLLGSGGSSLTWSQNATALYITMPAAIPAPCKYIYGFKIYCDAQLTTLAAPSNLEATAASNANVLTWVDNSTKETGFKIERKLGSAGVYTQIAIVGADVTTYNDSMASPVAYTYRVRAYNATLNSAYSNEATPQGVLTPTAVSVPEILSESRDFPNSLRSVTTVAGDNTIRFIAAHDARATFVLYSLDGRVVARTTTSANRGPNTFAWDNLGNGSSAIYFLEMRIDGQSKGVVRMVKTR